MPISGHFQDCTSCVSSEPTFNFITKDYYTTLIQRWPWPLRFKASGIWHFHPLGSYGTFQPKRPCVSDSDLSTSKCQLRHSVPPSFIFGPGRRVPKSHSSCSCCCYQFSKNSYGFLNMQWRAKTTHTFVLTFPRDLQSQIFRWHNAITSVIKVRFMLSI